MAYATVRSETGTVFTTSAGSFSVPLPATVSSGDKLIVVFGNNGTGTVTWPGGWDLEETVGPSSNLSAVVYSKTADGTEGGTTITVTISSNGKAASYAWAYQNASTVEVSTDATGSNTTPDPGTVTPSWGSEDNAYIALCVTIPGAVTGYPSGYVSTGTQSTGTGTGNINLGYGRKEAASSSENPGTFTLGTTGVWVAWTVAVRYSASSATLTDVDTDETITAGQSSVAYTGTGLTNADGLDVVTGTKSAAATSFSATNATSGTFTAPTAAAIRTAGVKFGSCTFSIEDGGVALATLAGTINPSSGLTVHSVTDISQAADTGCIYYGQSPAVAVNDQILFDSTTASNGWAVTIDSQGFVTIDSGGSSAEDSFSYYIWDATDETWGTAGTWTINESGARGSIRTAIRSAVQSAVQTVH